MGKGDKKTKKGKIIMGSYGVSRRKKANKPKVTAVVQEAEVKPADKKPVKPKAPKKPKASEA